MLRQHGLTLVELMVTLAVAIIVVSAGLPLFNGVVANNRASANANTLVRALNLARSEAVGRGANVTVCAASTNPVGATPSCGSATQWSNGWFVFVDSGTAGSVDGSDVRLRIFDMPSGNKPTVSVTGTAYVTFNFMGSGGSQWTFQLDQPGASGNVTRCVTVAQSGQIRTDRGVCP